MIAIHPNRSISDYSHIILFGTVAYGNQKMPLEPHQAFPHVDSVPNSQGKRHQHRGLSLQIGQRHVCQK